MQALQKVRRVEYVPRHLTLQVRHKKPQTTAQSRLEHRTLDPHFDKLSHTLNKLTLTLNLHNLLLKRKRGPHVSLQLTTRFKNILKLNNSTSSPVVSLIKKHPHLFHVFTHPVTKNPCCRTRAPFQNLIDAEKRKCLMDASLRVASLVNMGVRGGIGVKGLVLVRREFGLPDNWRELVEEIGMRVIGDRVAFEDASKRDGILVRAKVEDWRENEWKEKWLSEFEVKYAFPVSFPTGFRIVKGFKGKLRDWQRLPYLKPYERNENSGGIGVKSCGGVERYEKRAVAVLHEFLSLTVEKMVEVERLSHFRKDLGIEVNIREVLLRHPGIFYVSTKGGTQRVFLREAYKKGRLVESNPIYEVRRKMMDLVLLGRRNTRELKVDSVSNVVGGEGDGCCVVPMLDGFEDTKTEIRPV